MTRFFVRYISQATNKRILYETKEKSHYIKATQLLHQLQANKNYQSNQQELIKDAFKIYDKISATADYLAINPLLELCLKCRYPEKELLIWTDIKEKVLNKSTYLLLIQCCAKTLHVDKNKSKCIDILETIHPIIMHMNDADVYSKTCLINVYSQYSKNSTNKMRKALQIFNSIHNDNKSVVCIGAMLKCCINCNDNEMALSIYDNNTFQALHDDINHLLAITACKNVNNLAKGLQIIESINQKHKNKKNINIKLENTLIDFYQHFQDIKKAESIFNKILDRNMNVVSIGVMMKGFVNNKLNHKALSLYHRFASFRNDIIHLLAIKAAVNINDFEAGKAIIDNNKLNDGKNHMIELENTMIHFYGHFGDLGSALNTFNKLDAKKNLNEVVINCMMQAFINNHKDERALLLYDKYKTFHNDISHVLAIKCCINSQKFEEGQSIIAQLQYKENSNKLVQTALIDFYGHFNDLQSAKNIFNLLSDSKKDTVCIGAMMKCLINNNCNQEALFLYNKSNTLHDIASHVLALKSCINMKEFVVGQNIIETNGLLNVKNIQLSNSLISFYGECNDILRAENIFSQIPDSDKDVIAMNAMMNAYFDSKLYIKCIELFKRLENDYNLVSDNITYAIALKSCAQSTSLHFGEEIHEKIKKSFEMEKDLSVQINLINMYGKCAQMDKCEEIFATIKRREYENKYCKEISLWNVMIHSYSRNGATDKVFEIFNLMKSEIGLVPDRKTYILLINCCSYCGNVLQAIHLWQYDVMDENIKYDEYVVSTMIDCLARNGDVENAYKLMIEYENISDNKSNEIHWMALMNGCRVCKNKDMAQICYNEIVERFPTNTDYTTSASVLLANIHALCHEDNELLQSQKAILRKH